MNNINTYIAEKLHINYQVAEKLRINKDTKFYNSYAEYGEGTLVNYDTEDFYDYVKENFGITMSDTFIIGFNDMLKKYNMDSKKEYYYIKNETFSKNNKLISMLGSCPVDNKNWASIKNLVIWFYKLEKENMFVIAFVTPQYDHKYEAEIYMHNYE